MQSNRPRLNVANDGFALTSIFLAFVRCLEANGSQSCFRILCTADFEDFVERLCPVFLKLCRHSGQRFLIQC